MQIPTATGRIYIRHIFKRLNYQMIIADILAADSAKTQAIMSSEHLIFCPPSDPNYFRDCYIAHPEFVRDVLRKADTLYDYGQYDNNGPDNIPNSGDDDGYVDFVIWELLWRGGAGTTGLSINGDFVTQDTSRDANGQFRGYIKIDGSSYGWYGGRAIMMKQDFFPWDEPTADKLLVAWFHELGHSPFYSPDLDHLSFSPYDHWAIGSFEVMAAGGFKRRASLYNPTYREAHNWVIPISLTSDLPGQQVPDFDSTSVIYRFAPSTLPPGTLGGQKFSVNYYAPPNDLRNRWTSTWPHNPAVGGAMVWHTQSSIVGWDDHRALPIDIEAAHGKFIWSDTINTGVQNSLTGRDSLEIRKIVGNSVVWEPYRNHPSEGKGSETCFFLPNSGKEFAFYSNPNSNYYRSSSGEQYAQAVTSGFAVKNIVTIGNTAQVDFFVGDTSVHQNATLCAGTWYINGKIHVPAGVTLYVDGSVVLNFAPNLTMNIAGNFIVKSGASLTLNGKPTLILQSGAFCNIESNASLTISSDASFSMGSGNAINVDGTLIANGTSQEPITFTSINPSETWFGITSGSYPPTISLSYTNISNASTALNIGSYTNLTVDHCNISNCNMGINIFPTAHSPIPTMQITNNTFIETPSNGMGISIDNYSDILLAGNTLTGPLYYSRIKGTGIYLNASSPRMIGNSIQWFKTGFVCTNGSEAMLEDVEGPGNNLITNNTNAVICDMSNANLGYDYCGNSICYNSGVDVWIDGGSKVLATNDSWASNCEPGYFPGNFEIIDGEITYEPCAGSCGGAGPIAGNKNEQKLDEGEPMMTLVPTLIRQALRERRRGNHAQADVLLRLIVANGSMAREWKQWALGQLLAVGQSLRSGNLSNYFTTVASSQPQLARNARALLPSSFISEGSFTNAMTAYDANIRQYPNSNLERFGLYGKFAIQLNNRRDTTGAGALLNELKASFPQSLQAEMAELQLSSFRTSAGSSRLGGGMNPTSSQSAAPSTRIPTEFGLSQNYPNPFNPSTTIEFALPKDSHVNLKLYDLLGREVKSLVDELLTAGYHRVTLDGSSLATGVYLYRMTAGSFVATRKLLLVK